MTLRKEKILDFERGSSRSHCLENSLWKRLRTCRKTDYTMMMEVIDELQALAALLRCPLDRNLRGSDILLDETVPACNRSAIIAVIDCNLLAWICFMFFTLSNSEVCQCR
jgi:hypothetical protein